MGESWLYSKLVHPENFKIENFKEGRKKKVGQG